MRNLKKVVYIEKVQERHFSVIYGMLVLLTITVLTIWRIRKTKTIFTPNAFLHNVALDIPQMWPSLHSRGGGVTIPVPLTTPPPKPPRATLFQLDSDRQLAVRCPT